MRSRHPHGSAKALAVGEGRQAGSLRSHRRTWDFFEWEMAELEVLRQTIDCPRDWLERVPEALTDEGEATLFELQTHRRQSAERRRKDKPRAPRAPARSIREEQTRAGAEAIREALRGRYADARTADTSEPVELMCPACSGAMRLWWIPAGVAASHDAKWCDAYQCWRAGGAVSRATTHV